MWKGGEIPPLPRSREGNESPKSHSREGIVRGRRASRRPEAGRPIHLELERIGFKYGEKRVLQHVTLTVEKGEFFGILGPNGSGKSPLLNLIDGIRSPLPGQGIGLHESISLCERRMRSLPRPSRRYIFGYGATAGMTIDAPHIPTTLFSFPFCPRKDVPSPRGIP